MERFLVKKRSAEQILNDEPPAKKRENNSNNYSEESLDSEIEDSSADSDLADQSTCGTTSTSSSSSSKQAAGFQKKWLKKRKHWLEYIHGKGGMFCKLCRKHNKTAFGHDIWTKTPCKRLRLQSVTSHENSSSHKDAVHLELSAKSSQNIVSITNPAVPKRGIERAFASLYFLAKQRIPHTTNFEPFLDFIELLGVKVKSEIQVARNALYTSCKSIQEMIFILSEVIEMKILKEMTESDHFALMFDETTDCSVTEQLAIHGRYICKNSGELKTCFLKVIDVLQPEIDGSSSNDTTCVSVCASVITARVQEFIDKKQIDVSKLRGIGTDGAATMIGCHSGVVTRLKEIAPSAVGVHCAAHRLNLASTHAANAIPYVKKFNQIIRQLFDYFDNSVVRTGSLLAIQKLIQEKGKILAPCSTRWLSTESSVRRLKACFVSVVTSLQRDAEERSEAKAAGLSKMITEYRFVSTMLLFCDALPHVTHLSKCFQIQNIDYSIIPQMVTSTITSLEQLKVVNGTNLDELEQFLHKLSSAGIDITKQGNLGEQYFEESVRNPFLCQLIKNIENRFCDKSIMATFDIFNPKKLPKLSKTPTREELCAFVQYGNEEVNTLADHFDGAVDGEECIQEWSSFRQYLKDSCGELEHREVISDLCSSTSLTASVYPTMSNLAKICRVIPIHTSDVERTFSQLKIIKSLIRNRMCENTLDALLRIVTEGPSVENYPVNEAVVLWASKKNRRLSV